MYKLNSILLDDIILSVLCIALVMILTPIFKKDLDSYLDANNFDGKILKTQTDLLQSQWVPSEFEGVFPCLQKLELKPKSFGRAPNGWRNRKAARV